MTPLSFAPINGNVPIVKLLLEKGADVNMCDEVIVWFFSHVVFSTPSEWCQSSVCSQPGRPHRCSGATSPGRS